MNASRSMKTIRVVCSVLFISSIAGLIVSSIAGNNEGWVISIGMVAVAAAMILMVASLVAAQQRLPEFSDARAQEVERMVARLVEQGADEEEVRSLVRSSVQLGRGL